MRRAKTEADRQRLAGLLAYARDTAGCRRAALLKLLSYEGSGESPETACCDVCEGLSQPELREAPTLLSFLRKNRRRYTLGEAAQALAASEHLAWSDEEAKQALKLLLRDKRLRILKNPVWKNKITMGKG
jgi:ATP-dependent DNA helicase RecQ